MPPTPIDIIANKISAAGGTLDAGRLAEIVAEGLDDEAIVNHAVDALITDGRDRTRGGEELLRHDLEKFARTVLRSVRGAR